MCIFLHSSVKHHQDFFESSLTIQIINLNGSLYFGNFTLKLNSVVDFAVFNLFGDQVNSRGLE